MRRSSTLGVRCPRRNVRLAAHRTCAARSRDKADACEATPKGLAARRGMLGERRACAPGPGRTIAALAAGQPPKFRGNAERRADDRLRSLCLRRSSSSGSGRPDGRPPYRTAGIARMRGACHFW
ncbi:hypothetical protein BP1258A_3313 [Burkholderia pseudomallei 1258a]|nr:hypothetical protein BP1258A_3313 [Burkholderia pseudomallei 1258a]EIF61046.1 hypothetical protein BP1258B_3691 [Burkholderia pseudomallei 1258b]